ncbi:MAG: hypothetical protein O7H39_00770 [Gammaproteobacteria bacterium]|nr:hypothetical protein [Gammaproteobacteria bacterium]
MVVSDHRVGRMGRCLLAPLWFAALVPGDVLIFADTVIHGKHADIVALPGDPEQDIALTGYVGFVMEGRVIYKQ